MYDGLGVTRPRRSDDGGLTWAALSVSDGVTASAGCGPGASCLYLLNQTWVDAVRTFSCKLARSDDGGRTQSEPWEVPLSICQTGVLAVAPDSPDHLLAGCANAVCESHDGGHHFDTHLIDSNERRFVEHLAFLPSGVALLATRNVTERGFEASVVFERSLDGGSSWVEMEGLAALSYAGGFFASYAQPGTAFVVGNTSKSVFRSDDDGATWREASPPITDDASHSYDDPAILLVWGGIVDRAGGGFLTSTNQGLVHFE